MARAKRKAQRKSRAKSKPAPKRRIPRALRTEANRMRRQGKVPQRLLDALQPDEVDELFPDLDESDIYD